MKLSEIRRLPWDDIGLPDTQPLQILEAVCVCGPLKCGFLCAGMSFEFFSPWWRWLILNRYFLDKWIFPFWSDLTFNQQCVFVLQLASSVAMDFPPLGKDTTFIFAELTM